MPSILLTNEQAEAAVRNKLPTGTNLNSRQIADNWDDDARSKAFFSSRVAQADILAGFQRRIQQVVEGKISQGEAREWMRQLIESKGDSVLAQMGFKGAQTGKEGGITELASTSRLNLIIDQNVTMAHQSAAYQQAQDDLEFYPYVEYVSQDDGRVRPSHAALHGKIFKADSDEAALCWPPNGFRCRCRMRRLHAHEVKGRKVESGMPADYLEKKAQDTDTFSFDPRKQLPTAMQPRETWAPEVAKAYSEGVKADIDVEIAFMEKRRQVWLKEVERAKKPSYKAETLDAVANIDERLANLRKQKDGMDSLANTTQDHANKKQAEADAKAAELARLQAEQEAKRIQAEQTKAAEKKITVQTEEEYLSTHGAHADWGDSATHKNMNERQKKQVGKIIDQKDDALLAKRDELRKEYQDKVDKGEIRPPTRNEKLIRTANEHEDNTATQAARRILEKNGIDWRVSVYSEADKWLKYL